MIGKLTRENYLLKKEKEYLIQKKREDLFIITGPYETYLDIIAGITHFLLKRCIIIEKDCIRL